MRMKTAYKNFIIFDEVTLCMLQKCAQVLSGVFFFKEYFQGIEFLDWFMVYAPKQCIVHKMNDI